MVVKGSEQYRSVVIPHRPLRRACWAAFVCLLIGAAAIASYHYGYGEAQRDYHQAMEEWNHLHELTNQQAEQLQQLNQQVTNTEIGSNVNQQAMESLRQEIVQLNEKNTSLQESNNFYRQLMEEPTSNKGLAITSFTLTATNEPLRYHYEVVIQQLTKEHKTSTGKIHISVIGLTESVLPKITQPLKLRFYQTISGELVLPAGFEPKQVEVSAEKTGSVAVTANFDWVVKH